MLRYVQTCKVMSVSYCESEKRAAAVLQGFVVHKCCCKLIPFSIIVTGVEGELCLPALCGLQ